MIDQICAGNRVIHREIVILTEGGAEHALQPFRIVAHDEIPFVVDPRAEQQRIVRQRKDAPSRNVVHRINVGGLRLNGVRTAVLVANYAVAEYADFIVRIIFIQ